MDLSIVLTLAVTLGSLILFLRDKWPIESVAFIVLLAVLVLGLAPESAAISGFSNPATITVAAMLIISAGLQRTGVVRWLADKLQRLAGKGRTRLTLVLGTFCGVLSAFVSNTAMVAVLLPISLKLARERNISPSKVLMPMAFAAQFGGVCTLVGTTTNLIIVSIMHQAGLQPFGMFEFAKLGIIFFVVGTLYMLVASKLLPNRLAADASENYRLNDYLMELEILENSPLIGQTGNENDLVSISGDIRIMELLRDGKLIWAAHNSKLQEGDILLVRGTVDKLLENLTRLKLADWAQGNLSDKHFQGNDIQLLEVLVPRGSNLIGRNLSQLDFYWRYHAAVLGVRRQGQALRQRLSRIEFHQGDSLLLQGHKADLAKLTREADFMLLQDLTPFRLNTQKALAAVLVIIAVLTAATLGLTSILTASLVGVAAMVALRCLNLQEVYKAIDWKVILLLAGMIPLGIAMEYTGTADLIVQNSLNSLGHNPVVLLTVIYLLTSILTQLLSNAATAVLITPLAIGIAANLGINAQPLLVAVAFAASTCFTTPIGYQTNTMIFGPGGYKYRDFVVVGAPLNLIFMFIAVVMIPRIWPF